MSDDELALQAAQLYYGTENTQDEVATQMGLSRWKVGQLLATARDRGFVRIEVVHPHTREFALERELAAKYGLAGAVVAATGGAGQEELRGLVAVAAARFLETMSPAPQNLGISWGRTLHDVALALGEGWGSGVDVVQVNGGFSANERESTASITASIIAHKAGGSAALVPSPAILEHLATKRAMESDRALRSVLERAEKADSYLYSAGVVDERSVLVDSGYITPEEMAALVSRGAVADVLGRFIDARGEIVDAELDDRTIGISLDALRRSRRSIAVMAGRPKHAACLALVRSQLCGILITDRETAQFLLEAS
ncbi:sugar-binding transcriptional regulator [Herbiconiux sp. YIM B11900]|uniref:sugar-binding transcriptional regulator n=1 Tax=Herbiconiux sp. YIM B11900 TaxID=3404131 RepID=UPI003F829C01